MNTRATIAALLTVACFAVAGCSGPGHADGEGGGEHASQPSRLSSPRATVTPDNVGQAGNGIPPEPTGVERAQLLRALAAANPATVKYEDKAIDAARNQCGAINGGAQRLDYFAAQRFTYKDVTTSKAQGKQINQALKEGGFCEA
ncbi:hypothetical protein [Streptomyces sp. NPDC048643]|uniref:hypothetical protein n=1 Tax=Streptomyces sp. NPDC048643 TaxID=3155637 RepID=UPI003437BD17